MTIVDNVFQATQEIAYNDKLIASSEATIRTCEEELLKLHEIDGDAGRWFGAGAGSVSAREGYLRKKLGTAVKKVENLEARNTELKKVLVKEQ